MSDLAKYITICEDGVAICKIKRIDFLKAKTTKSSNLIDDFLVIETTKTKLIVEFKDSKNAIISANILNHSDPNFIKFPND